MVQQLRQSPRDHGAIEVAEEMQGLGFKVWTEGHADGRVEGRVEGHAEGRLKTVEGFIEAGASWELIETATGLNEAGFRKLQAQVAAQ